MNNPPLILIVDDEPEIRDLYSVKLKKAGYEVIAAANGQEGLDMAKSKHPDLILMDLKMPVMDGVEAVMHLREDASIKDTKVIFLTAFGDPQMVQVDVKFAKEISAVDFIKKGEGLDDIVARVKKALA